MYIGFNKYQVYGKIILLTIILSFIGLFILFHPPFPLRFSDNPSPTIIIMLPVVGVLILYMTVLMTLQLFFLPKGIKVDNINESLTLSFFGARSLIIQAKDIDSFGSVMVGTRSVSYEGFVLHINGGRNYLLGEFNLTEIAPIKSFLEANSVAFIGIEKFNFVSYFINYFKS